MTLHTCEYVSPRLRNNTRKEYVRFATDEEYVCFAMRMTRPL
jgi:hypothetical protein